MGIASEIRMNDAAVSRSELIARARAGDREALGELLEGYRGYLKVLTARQIDRRLGGRLDASDLVQQTFLSAYRKVDQFRGQAEAEFFMWLQRILEHNIQEAIRNHTRIAKRSIRREEPVPESQLAVRAAGDIRGTTPSQRAMQGEDAVRLARTLEKLPRDQREAVRLRHLEGWSLAEISEHMGRSPSAAAGLLKRGMQALRKYLVENPE